MKQPYAIVDIDGPKNSIKNKGSYYWTLKLVGVEDGSHWRTQVDASMNNFDRWTYIVNNPTKGYIIDNLRIKSVKQAMLNADSEFNLIEEIAKIKDLNEAIKALHIPPKNSFGDLFD